MLKAPRSGISLITDLVKGSVELKYMEASPLSEFVLIGSRNFKGRNFTVGNTNFSFNQDGVAKVFIKGPTVKQDIQKAINFHNFYLVEEKKEEVIALNKEVVDNAVEVSETVVETPPAVETIPFVIPELPEDDEPTVLVISGEEIPLETPKSKKRKSKKE